MDGVVMLCKWSIGDFYGGVGQSAQKSATTIWSGRRVRHRRRTECGALDELTSGYRHRNAPEVVTMR